MPRGGLRPGAGRKPGVPTLKTQEISSRAFDSGISPLEYMLSVMRDDLAPPSVRLDAAKSAAPYMHPRLAMSAERDVRPGPLIEGNSLSDVEAARRIAFILARGAAGLPRS